MKKLLLIVLAGSISLGSFAQMKGTPKLVDKMANSKTKIDSPVTPVQPTPVPSTLNDLKGTQTIDRYYIGKSANIYSVLLEEQRYVDYNETIGLTSFTFRADPATHPGALNSGSIITATSVDEGQTWNTGFLLNDGSYGRYPSGVIYNPDGNTDPAGAYVSAVGPVTNGTNWVSNFFASAQVNGDNQSSTLINVDPDYSGSQLVRSGMQATEDGMVHILTSKYQDNGSGYSTEMNLNIWSGLFNGSGFDWNYVDVPVDLAFRNDGTTKNFWTFGSSWSPDGTVGYAWLIGQTEEMVDAGGYQPVVFYTTDQGENWDEITVELEDNEVISQYLIGTQQGEGPVWPLCSEMDGVVDANNNLQMFIKATGTFSNHPDSIGYSYSGALNYIFNIELSTEGVQNVMFVDSLLADDVPADNQYALGGVEGWGTRLRASRTDNGDAVFAVWTDTENASNYDGVNAAPNIKAAGRYISGAFDDGTFPLTNFTIDDLYAGFYFFINVSQFVEKDGPLYTIPVTTTVTPGEYGGGTELTPVTHTYLRGISYLVSGVSEESSLNSNITVAQNQPNPFTGTTTIQVSSKTVAPVSVEVTNMLGQVVYTQNAGTINGTMNVELNASQLEAGVYFYTVRLGADSVTKKMIVE